MAAGKKLTPLARDLRTLSKPNAPAVNIPGVRRHFAAKSGADNAKPIRTKPMKESAAASLYSGDLVSLLFQSLKIMPDPDEVLRKKGLTRASLKKLTYDDEIFQALDTRREAAINTPWRLENGSEESRTFIEAEIKKHAEKIFSGLWNARPYGYSVTQVVFEDRGDRVGLRWVGEMPIQYYFPQRDGTVTFRPAMQGEPVPIVEEKYLIPIVNPTYENPYGDALLSRLFWLWFFRTHGWQYWVQWLEQFGTPFLVGKTPLVIDPETNTKSVEVLASILDKSRRGSAIAVDSDSEVTSIETKGTGQQFALFDDATSRQIVKVILGQTLSSGEGKHGTQALGKVHEEVRQDKRIADIKLIRGGGQKLVTTLHVLNKFSGPPPDFVMEDEKGLQKDRADRDANLVDKGVVIFTRPYLEERYDLEPDDFFAPGEEGFKAAKPAPVAVDPNAPKPKDKTPVPDKAKKQAAADLLDILKLFDNTGHRFTPEQEVIETGVADMIERLPTEILSADDIKAAIRESVDGADLQRRLAIVLEGADPQVFRLIFERALGVAEILGYVHAAERPTPEPEKTAPTT